MRKKWILSIILVLLGGCFTSRVKKPIVSEIKNKIDAKNEANKKIIGLPKKRVFILGFINKANYGKNDLELLAAETLQKQLMDTAKYVMLPLKNTINDLTVIKDNQFVFDKVVNLGLDLGVGTVIYGTIVSAQINKNGEKVGFFKKQEQSLEIALDITMVDINNATVLMNSTKSEKEIASFTTILKSTEEDVYNEELSRFTIQKTLDKFIPEITAKLDRINWLGRVALIEGQNIYINAGKESGLRANDILLVSEEGKDVFDPVTGRLIGKARGRVKGTLKIKSYFGDDGAIAVIKSGSGFDVNDKVELY